MNPLTIEFKNYKLLKDKKFVFPQEGNIYFVLGSNEQGKTSFINSMLSFFEAKSKSDTPLSFGEKEGDITLEIEDKNGNPFLIKFEFSEKKEKFTLVTPEGISTSKVGDIRKFFDYHAYTAEGFVKLGNNAKDRKEQRNIFLGLMGKDHKELFYTVEDALSTSFDLRKAAGASLKALEGSLSTTIPKEDTELLAKKADLLAERENLQIKQAKANEQELRVSQDKFAKQEADKAVLNAEVGLEDAKRALTAAIELLEEANKNAIRCNNKLINIPVIEVNPERLREIQLQVDRINEIAGKAIAAEESKKRIDEVQITWDKHNDNVVKYREELTDIITKHGPNIPGIAIHSDGLYFETDEGEVPFTEENVSTSAIYKITARILMALNTKTPIICMGRTESLDNNTIEEIAKIAEEVKAKLYFDRVLPVESDIQLIGYEDLQDTLIKNLKDGQKR